jgi:hypothetical protein
MKSPNLTTHHYRVATIFVNSYSDFTFIWNQTTTNAEQTLGAKQAFERFASANNIHIHHYHADKGQFAEPTFVNAISSKGQTTSFSGVGAQHQSGVADRRIRDLQDSARAMLIHAYRRWPITICVNLWPYALSNATYIRNVTTNEKGQKTPVAAFARVERDPRLTLFIFLAVQSMFWMQECSQDRQFLNGRRGLALASIYVCHHLMRSQSHWCSPS